MIPPAGDPYEMRLPIMLIRLLYRIYMNTQNRNITMLRHAMPMK